MEGVSKFRDLSFSKISTIGKPLDFALCSFSVILRCVFCLLFNFKRKKKKKRKKERLLRENLFVAVMISVITGTNCKCNYKWIIFILCSLLLHKRNKTPLNMLL